MKEKEYKKLRKGIEEQYQKQIEALNIVWDMSNSCPPPTSEQRQEHKSQQLRKPKGQAAELVSEALEAFDGSEFTARNIDDWIQENGGSANRTTISHKLKSMVGDGQIRIVSEGKGKRATVYEHVPHMVEKIDLLKKLMLDRGEVEELALSKFGVNRVEDLEEDQVDELIAIYEVF